MSTSCLYGFKKKGKLKLAYNRDDSYPSGFGRDVILFIRENTLEELNEICDSIRLVKREDFPQDEDILEMIKKDIYYKDDEKILTWNDIYYFNSYILEYYKKGFFVMPDYSDWIDTLQDYLYIINLDSNKFEVYHMKLSNEEKDSKSEFETHKLIKSFDINNIPRDWDINL